MSLTRLTGRANPIFARRHRETARRTSPPARRLVRRSQPRPSRSQACASSSVSAAFGAGVFRCGRAQYGGCKRRAGRMLKWLAGDAFCDEGIGVAFVTVISGRQHRRRRKVDPRLFISSCVKVSRLAHRCAADGNGCRLQASSCLCDVRGVAGTQQHGPRRCWRLNLVGRHVRKGSGDDGKQRSPQDAAASPIRRSVGRRRAGISGLTRGALSIEQHGMG